MAGRGGDDKGAGGDDFDWIYGSPGSGSGSGAGRPSGPGGAGAPGRSDPEPTRRIPVQRQRPTPAQPDPGRAPAPGTPPPGSPPPRQPRPPRPPSQRRQEPAPAAPKRGRRPRRRSWRRIVLGLLALWLVFLVAVPLVSWNRVEKVPFEPDGERPGDQPGMTYLLVGSDSRAGLSKEEREQLTTGDATSNLTDTIMLLHTGDGPTTLISIPRDSPLEIPGRGRAKVNSAYARGGAPLLAATLENATGVRIDQYVEIGLGGLVGVVDAVGGIEICPKRRIRDKPSGLDVRKGCQEVDGVTALAYSRARKYSPISDLARVQQQREVVAAVGEKVLSPWTVLNPVRWWKLNNAVPDFFRFGEGMSPVTAARWALAMTSVEKSCTVPLAGANASWDEERASGLFAAVAEDRTGDITKAQCTATGLAD
ncbi:LCP family protein [Nocardioides sp. zg-536]|uniref:LCP family protein n=1 Tax=Nocardioides faecalis TaxID=2803858 RepID=A0A939BXH5_9ACTN|nr:LCP family protein [Nocardioides faecalis]MBM9459343.1 LCP family protein [Nocardioides faecalis]QVI59540.1 LCP family protein [Nocardioides faecalis]